MMRVGDLRVVPTWNGPWDGEPTMPQLALNQIGSAESNLSAAVDWLEAAEHSFGSDKVAHAAFLVGRALQAIRAASYQVNQTKAHVHQLCGDSPVMAGEG